MIYRVGTYMKIQFENAEDFNHFKKELKNRLEKWDVRHIDSEGHKIAAVKMIIMNKNNQPHVLLTKRSEKVATHKGQISFPGGIRDEEDKNIIDTAYRETFEEVGIPQDKIEYIGRFDDYVSIYGHHVACFIGSIDYPIEYNFNEDEIDDYVEAPLSIFVNEEYERAVPFEYKGKSANVFYYYYENHEIWGMTARILTDFARKIIKG